MIEVIFDHQNPGVYYSDNIFPTGLIANHKVYDESNKKHNTPALDEAVAIVAGTLLVGHEEIEFVEIGAALLLDVFEGRSPQPRGAIARMPEMK